jgi:predicted transporter
MHECGVYIERIYHTQLNDISANTSFSTSLPLCLSLSSCSLFISLYLCTYSVSLNLFPSLGDMVDVTFCEGISGFFGMKTSRKGKVLSVSTMQNIAKAVLAKDTGVAR